MVEEPKAAVVEEPKAAVVEQPESILAEMDSAYDAVTESEDDGEEMELDRCVHEGETYYVDLSNGDIYDVDEDGEGSGEIIGHWEGDAETGSPSPN